MSCWWARRLRGPEAAPPRLGLPSAFCLTRPAQLGSVCRAGCPSPSLTAPSPSGLGRLPQRAEGLQTPPPPPLHEPPPILCPPFSSRRR